LRPKTGRKKKKSRGGSAKERMKTSQGQNVSPTDGPASSSKKVREKKIATIQGRGPAAKPDLQRGGQGNGWQKGVFNRWKKQIKCRLRGDRT